MDHVAREYLLIGLSLGRLQEGVVDSYFGPSELADEAAGANASAQELADRASNLRATLADEVEDAQRRDWLDRQLLALATIGQRLAGVDLPYLEEVERCFDAPPEATPAEDWVRVRLELDELLPGTGDLRERIDARDERLTIPADRVAAIAEWLVGELRADSATVWRIPEGERLAITMVTDQPWGAYNWYEGDLSSRVEVNLDLPTRATQLIGTLAHETFPGHHFEHSWKETRLVRERGYAEASIQLINTPEAFISEGLAEVGHTLLLEGPRWQQLLLEVCERAGIDLDATAAEREWRTAHALRQLRGSSGDAALQLHVGKRSPDEVARFLEQDALFGPGRARKTLEFITHPLWRTYVFCYAGGDRLLSEWCAQAGSLDAQRKRYFRLVTEQLTPSAVAAEMN